MLLPGDFDSRGVTNIAVLLVCLILVILALSDTTANLGQQQCRFCSVEKSSFFVAAFGK
jgi:hypothetical protein